MNVKKNAILLILVGIVITGCSSIDEKKLLGQWQSKGPKAVRLDITRDGTDDEGLNKSYASRSESYIGGIEQTYINSWQIESGNILALSGGSLDRYMGGSGQGHRFHGHYPIIELTSDRLVTQFNGKIEEFQRIK